MIHTKDYYVNQFADILSEVSDEDCTDYGMLVEAFQEAIGNHMRYHSAANLRYLYLSEMLRQSDPLAGLSDEEYAKATEPM